MESKEIPNSEIKVSSQISTIYAYYKGRLNYQLVEALSWCPARPLDSKQWIQIGLGHTMLVTGVVTQGRGNGKRNWVKSYKVLYSMDEKTWLWYKDDENGSQQKIFPGNSDDTSYVTNMFNRDIKAKFIRINPITWYDYICMRASVIGRRKGKLGSPVFTNQDAPSYITAYKNQGVTLQCEAVGDTPINITWTHKGKVVQSKTNDPHLTLTNVNKLQEGFYNCKASNSLGTNNKDLYLQVKDSIDACIKHQSLLGASRLVSSSMTYINDDSSLNDNEWYVFKSNKGFSRIPLTCIAQYHCGATAPGYMQGSLPTVNEGIVKRKVCFHSSGNCCQYSVDIYVLNCYMFYVYKLKKLYSSRKAAYCTEEYVNENPSRIFQSHTGPFLTTSKFIAYRFNDVDSDSTCMQYCMVEVTCSSFSYSRKFRVCELNNATKSQFSNQVLRVRPDYLYYDEAKL